MPPLLALFPGIPVLSYTESIGQKPWWALARGKKIRRALATEKPLLITPPCWFPRLQVLHSLFQILVWSIPTEPVCSCSAVWILRLRRKKAHGMWHKKHNPECFRKADPPLWGPVICCLTVLTLEMNIWGKMNWWSGSGEVLVSVWKPDSTLQSCDTWLILVLSLELTFIFLSPESSFFIWNGATDFK